MKENKCKHEWAFDIMEQTFWCLHCDEETKDIMEHEREEKEYRS